MPIDFTTYEVHGQILSLWKNKLTKETDDVFFSWTGFTEGAPRGKIQDLLETVVKASNNGASMVNKQAHHDIPAGPLVRSLGVYPFGIKVKNGFVIVPAFQFNGRDALKKMGQLESVLDYILDKFALKP